MGWWGWTETHPFTIASVSETEEGLVLLCKKAGKWTGKLYEMAIASGYGESGKGRGRNVMVMLEGPYGMLKLCRCGTADENSNQVVRDILSTRAIPQRYLYVVGAVFHSDFRQCKTLCRRI
jgi:hypothetical protein